MDKTLLQRWFGAPWEGVWSRALRQRNPAAIIDWFSTWFFAAGIVLLLVIDAVGSPGGFAGTARVAAGSLMLAAASVVAGWLLGLLFGVPRTMARPDPVPPAATVPAPGTSQPVVLAPRPSRTNTNLEDVSDWLTKTIVGLGLANLYVMPGYLWHKSGQLARQLYPGDAGGQAFVLLIGVYFGIGGFWIGYIGARTMITLLFDGIDSGFYTAVEKAADPGNLRVDSAGAILPATDGLLQADEQVLARPLTTLGSTRELAAWAAAKARRGELQTAAAVLGEAARDAPADPAIRSLLSSVGGALRGTSPASPPAPGGSAGGAAPE